MEILGSALQVGYELMYGQKFSGDRRTLLQGLPKRNLVYELAGLNNMLKSAIEKEFKIDPEEQMKILMYFCNGNYNASLPYRQRLQLIYNYLQQKAGGGTPVLFSRATILVCLNEILAETELDVDDSYGWTIEARKKFLDYFLCVTDLVSSYQVQSDSDKFRPIEKLAAGSAFFNELTVVNDPFFTVYRFVSLSEFMRSDDALSPAFDQHFKNMNIEHLTFARHVMSMCMFSKTKDAKKNFFYSYDEANPVHKESIAVLNYLSERKAIPQVHELDLVSLKKAPVYKDPRGFYVLLDTTFVLEKVYELFVNDFWFDTVKSNDVKINKYRGRFGLFFERYALSIVKKYFVGVTIKGLDQLKVKIGKDSVELCDLYVRDGKNVCLGEVKSSGIYGDQGYGTAQSLFKSDEDYLYESFGLNQVVKSIRYLRDQRILFDTGLDGVEKLDVYPVIIVNEKVFQTPLFPIMFDTAFRSKIAGESFPDFYIKPITIIHIADLERISYHISQGALNFWKLLELNFTQSVSVMPFNLTLNRIRINPDYAELEEIFLNSGVLRA